MYLFDVTSRHMTWLSERQAVTAGNIANADTPGYRAKAIAPFEVHLQDASLQLSITSDGHLPLSLSSVQTSSLVSGQSWASSHSGNNVSLETELMTASSTNRMMSIDSSVLRSFHRMFLSAVKV